MKRNFCLRTEREFSYIDYDCLPSKKIYETKLGKKKKGTTKKKI